MWAAGFLSIFGTLYLRTSAGKKTPILVIKSKIRKNAVMRFAQIAGVNVINSDEGMKVTLSGKSLHRLMRRLWDELSYERKAEYAALRKTMTPDPWRED